jgi:hypothetical protein
MSTKVTQISTTFIVRNRPLTRIALDNKIRAMMSQFHPCERQFVLIAHENTLDRNYTINSIRNHYLQTKISFTPFVIKDTTKIDHFSLINKQTDEYIYTYKKVIQWLEDLDCDLQRKKN